MRAQDVPALLRYLKANGAWVELDDDAEDAWAWALRNFDGAAVKAGVLSFLEKSHPREIAPATIAASVRSLMASGRIQEPACPDHPEELARSCRCCKADVLAGDRPRELIGRSMTEALIGGRGEPPRRLSAGPVTRPTDLRAVDPGEWDRLHAAGAAERAQALADDRKNPAETAPGGPGAPAPRLRVVSG